MGCVQLGRGTVARRRLSQATPFWTVERTSMFGYSNMIPPQGVDRRGPIAIRGGKEKAHCKYGSWP